MSVTDKPHTHGGMSVDFSKLTPEQRAKVEEVLQRNNAMQAMTGFIEGAGSGVAEFQEQRNNIEKAQFGIDETTSAVDGTLGYAVGGAVANALTPKLEQQAMKQGMTKLAPFLGRYIAPRILGATAGTTMGPAGTAIGFVAPELAFQTAEMMSNSPRMPTEQKPQSPDRMSQIVQQNPQLEGTPDVFIKALQGPGVGFKPNALNAR
jgi:hypothetical protein